MRELELYLHIPFCVRKCAYCDFLSFPAGKQERTEYVEALKTEIASFPYKKEYRVSSVFFGGGTPSLLSGEQIAGLMETLCENFCFEETPEISLECNPGTADEAKLRLLHEAGVNRLSFGLQSADNRELALLGRIHTREAFLRTYEAARKVGFQNVNVDLMSALPGQTVASWERTLREVLALKPEHLSAYSLIIEEGTPFFGMYHEDDERRERGEQPRFLPSEEDERRMYELTEAMLAEAGMHRYEISNYALPGYECRHNIGYWRGTEYAGFGLGASSLLRHVRYRNPANMQSYLSGDFSEREKEVLDTEDQMEEFMFLGLRMIEGISESEFAARFGKTVDEVYAGELEKLVRQRLLTRKGGRIALTEKGIDLSNVVMAEFLN